MAKDLEIIKKIEKIIGKRTKVPGKLLIISAHFKPKRVGIRAITRNQR